MYLFHAVDSAGQTVDFYLSESRDREAAKLFLKRAWQIPITNRRRFSLGMDCAAIQPLFANCNRKVTSMAAANKEQRDTVTTALNRTTAT
jgi:transposase-like protein